MDKTLVQPKFFKSSVCYWAFFSLCTIALFWPGLMHSQVPAFRDASHFYYPQAVWLDQCVARGEYFPLWQPNEGFGNSVPGETTSAIFYPMRILWFIPFTTVAQRFSIAIISHLGIAALGMSYACHRLHLRREAGWIAGTAYALSCPVMFQHNNFVYLCSAAWLGFAIGEFACLLNWYKLQAQAPRMAVLAAALALMVLGGDPHTPVNFVIVVSTVILVQSILHRRLARSLHSFRWLVGCVLLAVGLSSVQSIPSAMWATQSHRWQSHLFAIHSQVSQESQVNAKAKRVAIPEPVVRLLSEPSISRASNYEFSLSPWHLLTAAWPTLGGSFSPVNARLFSLLPAEGRMWIPSLFLGIIPLLLAVQQFRCCRTCPHRWLVFAATFALVASLGNYSIGWLLRQALHSALGPQFAGLLPADHLSSLYGWLAEIVPGYGVFRYPAKWTVIAVGCLAILAAIRLNEVDASSLLKLNRSRAIFLSASVLGLVTVLILPLVVQQPSVRPDPWLGPTDLNAMLFTSGFSFCVPLVVLLGLHVVYKRVVQLREQRPPQGLPVHTVIAWIALLELFVVSTQWCSFIEQPSISDESAQIVWCDQSQANIVTDRWPYHSAQEVFDYQRQFLVGKLGLLDGKSNLTASTSIEPDWYRRLRIRLAGMDNQTELQPDLDVVLGWLGANKRLVRTADSDVIKQRQLFWQNIESAKPLCELVQHPNSTPNLVGKVDWRWTNNGSLSIDVQSDVACILLVRQFNDGGWHIEIPGGGQATIDELDRPLPLVTIDIAPGHSHFLMVRNRWPVVVGAIVSLIFLVVVLWRKPWDQVNLRR